MRSFFEIIKGRFLHVSFFVFFSSMFVCSYMVLAGGLPPDVRQDIAEEQPAEVVVETPEVFDIPEKSASGLTVGVRGYLGLVADTNFSAPGTTLDGVTYGPLSGSAEHNGGYSLNFLLGYAFGNGLRVEAEAGYLHSCLDKMNVKEPGTLVSQLGLNSSGSPCLSGTAGCISYEDLPSAGQQAIQEGSKGEADIKGGVSAFLMMLNAYYDINPDGKIVPYVGGGVGVLNFSAETESTEGVTSGNVLLDDSDYAFAYQVGGGLGYKIDGIGDGSDVILSVDYRYLASFDDPEFDGAVTGTTFETDFSGHFIGGGIRIAF